MCSGSNGFNGNTGIGLAYGSPYTNLTSNNNDIIVSGTSSVTGRTGSLSAGTTFTTLANWQTETGGDNNSVSINPVFVSGTDYHIIAGSNTGIENAGMALSSVTSDIDCDTRTSTPDMGADEVCYLPTAASIAASINPICFNDTSVLSVTAGALHDATSWQWYTGSCGGTAIDTGISISVHPAITTDYFVRAEGGCVTGGTCANITLAVNALPTVSYTVVNNDSICIGDSVTLSGTGANSYSWTGGITDANPFAPSITTTYIVTGTDINNCINYDTATVTVNPLPTVGYTAAPDTQVCVGTTVTLSGTGATSYSWTGGITNGTGFTPASSGSYIVTGTDINGCSNTNTASITVNSLPTVNLGADIVQVNPPATLDAGLGFAAYNWSTSETTQTISVNTNGTYIVTVTDGNGCENSDTIQVTFTLSINNNNGTSATIKLFPVPAEEVLNLQITNLEYTEVQIILLDAKGSIVEIFTPVMAEGTYNRALDISGLASGMYILKLNTHTESQQLRFIKK